MKFLVDQNLAKSLVDRLLAASHEAQHTQDLRMERAVDPDIFQWCRDNDSVLLTADKKLTKFLASERATAPTVVVFRDYHLDFDRLAADLMANLPAIEQTITTQGAAVFSIACDRPTRAQLLPLISDV